MVDQQPNSSAKPTPPDQAGSPAPSAAGAGPAPPSATQDQGGSPQTGDGELARLRAELAEANDRALRGWAELENYRKRANRQLEEERRYAALPLMRDLLPVLDNVKRAIKAAEAQHDAASLLEGIKMVAEQLESVLRRHHGAPIVALNQPFDPNRHEAISRQPTRDVPPNTVVQEVQQGFLLHDRVIRPSRVIVSAPVQEPADAGGSPDKPSSPPR